jgi:V/A-type H+-transporting ATPase subunit F
MRATVRAVALPAAAAGLRLAGLAVDEVPTARAAPARILALADHRDVGVLLVEQDLLAAVPEPDRRALLDRPVPIVVPFPPPVAGGAGPAADTIIREILQRAIGYRVRLK